jgi:hypothetical protein
VDLEVIRHQHAHSDYWLSIAREEHNQKIQEDKEGYDYENDVPDFEIYIVDLWPPELKEVT